MKAVTLGGWAIRKFERGFRLRVELSFRGGLRNEHATVYRVFPTRGACASPITSHGEDHVHEESNLCAPIARHRHRAWEHAALRVVDACHDP